MLLNVHISRKRSISASQSAFHRTAKPLFSTIGFQSIFSNCLGMTTLFIHIHTESN